MKSLFSRSLRQHSLRQTFASRAASLAMLATLSFTSFAASSRLHAEEEPELSPAVVLPAQASQRAQLDASSSATSATTTIKRVNAQTGNFSDSSSQANIQGATPVDLAKIRRVKVAGTLLEDAPLRVGNLDVLAPIVGDESSLLSQLGATASRVSAQNIPGNANAPSTAQSFQLNMAPRPPIVLTVGQSVAYVNGQEQQLRAAPLVIGGKIWLPIFSIAPLLGAAARVQPDGTLNITPTIQSVEIFPVGGNIAVTIQASAPIPEGRVLVGTDDNPDKVYFDFSGYAMGFDAANSTGERVVSVGAGDVQQVRAGMPQTFPDITRVVLDLKKKVRYVVQPTADKTMFALLIGTVPNRPPVAIPETSPRLTNPSPKRLPTDGSLRGLTIVVDPGHGGHDSGAPGAKSYEKNHTLDISRRLRTYLERRGATVLMTRDGDYFIPLQGRTDFANARRADIFLSVHIDSYKSSSGGSTTHFYTGISQPLAREIQKELANATGLKNRGTMQSRFFVVRKTWMPSVLAEVAFISNPREEALLVNAAWRDRVAKGLAQGVANYVAKYGVN